jgi:regulator of sirC expression with transglutaminase-like and TPR domain
LTSPPQPPRGPLSGAQAQAHSAPRVPSPGHDLPGRARELGEFSTHLTGQPKISPEQRRALVLLELIDDESPVVTAAIRTELLALGDSACGALRRATGDERPRVRARARTILAEIEWKREWRRLSRTATGGKQLDLEASLFRMARLDDPKFDARGYRKALDAMAKEVRTRAEKATDSVTTPMALVDYLGNELGYIGSEVDYDHPDNIHLHRAIVRKRGMPLTLTAVYLCVARRAGIRAAAVPLPGHILLRLYAGRRSILVDPFHGGRMRTRADCLSHLARHGLVPRPEWMQDATDAQLFQRQVRNLMNSMQMRGLRTRSDSLAVLAGALARTEAACRSISTGE